MLRLTAQYKLAIEQLQRLYDLSPGYMNYMMCQFDAKDIQNTMTQLDSMVSPNSTEERR